MFCGACEAAFGFGWLSDPAVCSAQLKPGKTESWECGASSGRSGQAHGRAEIRPPRSLSGCAEPGPGYGEMHGATVELEQGEAVGLIALGLCLQGKHHCPCGAQRAVRRAGVVEVDDLC